MNKIWRSVVGKLWATILLLVSFIVFVFTVLMLEFLEEYHTEQAESSLRQTATTIAKLIDDNEDPARTLTIVQDILPQHTNALIATDKMNIAFAVQEGINEEHIQADILTSNKFDDVYVTNQPIVREMMLPSNIEEDRIEKYVVLGFPIDAEAAEHGAIFIYESPAALREATTQTTRIVFISAIIAFVLTTFFAFFLSSRITLPLRRMREAAFEVAKGKFDTKVEYKGNDEIGQLATAFNKMARQVHHHLEVSNQEKEQLSSILTSMTDAVITFNRDETILVTNPLAEKQLQEWYAQKAYDESTKHLPPELYHMLDHVLHFEDHLSERVEIGGRYLIISLSPLYSGNTVRGALVVIRDKTEQHRLDKLRADFVSNVSHELRTPIAMLQGYSEAIIDGVVQSEEEKDEMIRIIYDESQRMNRLVSDLLTLARTESGKMRLYKDFLPVASTFERMTYKFSQIAREKQVTLRFVSEYTDDYFIEMDEDRIEQVLTNLIDNALRYTPQDGTVQVSVWRQVGTARIEVRDTGQGIPKEDLPFVFERFYKADKARTRGKGGTGLGLAIAKNIVEAHNGTIKVDSIQNVGTTFTFELPIEH
ncbi:ATP-binding protein [Caryophanon latum]|uniref:histidine kinase n=1 Tax=Caryophanon latum TaxID=33977 RepID=A0A1C0YZ96_9BACL|nr:ATP-binding protein [Caryophanon latum]OCS92433.1 histidine kinase [Caryophanon latum]